MNNFILVTGGAGYIGSHMVRILQDKGYRPIVFDNLSTGYEDFVPTGIRLFKGDLKDIDKVREVFSQCKFSAVVHFAASIMLPESIKDPLKYYENNFLASLNLIKVMTEFGVDKMIFSSTAAVYGEPKKNPIDENAPTKVDNAYGRSKLMVENMLRDVSRAYDLKYIAFRYFNVAGAHDSATIGIKSDASENLISMVMKAASGRRDKFNIFGDNYKTKDGTCIRDFIHVLDLCDAHLLGLESLSQGIINETFNLGTSTGYSVKEVVDLTKKITNKDFTVDIAPRREGDKVCVVADFVKAKKKIRWQPKRSLEEMLSSAWKWEQTLKSA